MRPDKTFARILFIFSIANVVLAAPASVRQKRLVTNREGDKSTSESTPLLAPNPDASSSSAGAQSPSPAGSLHQDSAPASVAPQPNDPQTESGTPESHYVPPSYVPPPTPGNPSSKDDPPLGSEAQPSLDHTPPASEAAQLHSNPSPGTELEPHPFFENWDTHPSWHDVRPITEIEEVAEPERHVTFAPDVQVMPDVHKDQGGDNNHDFNYDYETKSNFDDGNEEVKGLCYDCSGMTFSDVLAELKNMNWKEMWHAADTGPVHWRRTWSFK